MTPGLVFYLFNLSNFCLFNISVFCLFNFSNFCRLNFTISTINSSNSDFFTILSVSIWSQLNWLNCRLLSICLTYYLFYHVNIIIQINNSIGIKIKINHRISNFVENSNNSFFPVPLLWVHNFLRSYLFYCQYLPKF